MKWRYTLTHDRRLGVKAVPVGVAGFLVIVFLLAVRVLRAWGGATRLTIAGSLNVGIIIGRVILNGAGAGSMRRRCGRIG